MTGQVACFGEMLLRLSAPQSELLLQSARLDARFGGAEANVAVSLARFGHAARIVTVLPDNAIGHAARDEVRRHGVATEGLRFAEGRMGLYFLTPGAVRRPSEVLYDRADSAFARHVGEIDVDAALAGCDWLHLSGITPAVGAAASEAALRAVRTARAKGVKVSFDGNYRAKLWAAWSGDGPAVLRELIAHADLLFGDERDLALVLGRPFEGGDLMTRRRGAVAAAFDAFPHLHRICATVRIEPSAGDNTLSAHLFARDGGEAHTEAVELAGIVDRIGGGDAFAAGVLHGLIAGWDDARTLAFALAAAAYKHAVPGDFNLASEAEILAALSDAALSVRR